MITPRTRAGVLATKAAAAASRRLGLGGGTAIGGLAGLRVAPSLVSDLATGLKQGSILITGTNGKTTTSHLVAMMARQSGLKAVANASGSNLMQGIAGSLAAAAGLNGRFSVNEAIGVFEVDEAVLPAALEALDKAIWNQKVNWVLDADVRSFFDAMVHEWAVTFVEHRIGDKRVLRLIRKWLTAGVLEDGMWSEVEQGTPQGGSLSPLLANVYRRLFGYGGTVASLLP